MAMIGLVIALALWGVAFWLPSSIPELGRFACILAAMTGTLALPVGAIVDVKPGGGVGGGLAGGGVAAVYIVIYGLGVLGGYYLLSTPAGEYEGQLSAVVEQMPYIWAALGAGGAVIMFMGAIDALLSGVRR